MQLIKEGSPLKEGTSKGGKSAETGQIATTLNTTLNILGDKKK